MRSRSIVGWWSLALLGIGILFLAFLGFARACSAGRSSRIRVKLEDLPQDKQSVSNHPVPVKPLLCPDAGVKPLEEKAPHTGHHKVFLRWNASIASKEAPNEAAGYCLYRIAKKKNGKKKDEKDKKDEVKKNPTCRDCEQVNKFAVKGTACVDDLVQDGETYFYVAVAIAQNRDVSTTSNEITAEIPRTPHPVGPPPPGIYPSCRVARPEQGSPGTH